LHRRQGGVIRYLNRTRSFAAVALASAVRACGLRAVQGGAAGLVLVVVLVTLGTAADSVWASFPGKNGQIVYNWVGPSAYRAGPVATSIRVVDPRSRRVRVLRDCPLRDGFTDCTVGEPRFSPDGRRIAFPNIRIAGNPIEGWQYFPGFATMAADGTGFEEHATGNASPAPPWMSYTGLAWPPAGDRLLLERALALPDTFKHAIFLATLDGIELSQVTSEGTSMPDWASTGEIAFTRMRDDPSCYPACSDIWLMRLGATPRRLTFRGGHSPSWSPHGTKLAFARLDLNRSRRGVYSDDIYTVGRDGRGLRRLTRRGGSNPAWSPDGKWIAFIRHGDIFVVRSTGGRLRRVVNAPPQTSYGWTDESAASPDWQALPRR
jgi:WD40-like Beta Propeller Repeat